MPFSLRLALPLSSRNLWAPCWPAADSEPRNTSRQHQSMACSTRDPHLDYPWPATTRRCLPCSKMCANLCRRGHKIPGGRSATVSQQQAGQSWCSLRSSPYPMHENSPVATLSTKQCRRRSSPRSSAWPDLQQWRSSLFFLKHANCLSNRHAWAPEQWAVSWPHLRGVCPKACLELFEAI